MELAVNTFDLARETVESGGLTVNPFTAERPTQGYAVSIIGRETRVALHYGTVQIGLAIGRYIDAYAPDFTEGIYLGTWTHGDSAFLDLSVVLADETDARIVSRLNGQLAYYDIAAGREVLLEGVPA
jgi:hypothetical protein